MLGFGDKHGNHVDPTKLPIFVHSLQNNDTLALTQKVWEANNRYLLLDPANKKELLRFVFADPACVIWLQRDQGRTDTYEFILLWDAVGDKEQITEVYVISAASSQPLGDVERVTSLLQTVLSSAATVPVNQPREDAKK